MTRGPTRGCLLCFMTFPISSSGALLLTVAHRFQMRLSETWSTDSANFGRNSCASYSAFRRPWQTFTYGSYLEKVGLQPRGNTNMDAGPSPPSEKRESIPFGSGACGLDIISCAGNTPPRLYTTKAPKGRDFRLLSSFSRRDDANGRRAWSSCAEKRTKWASLTVGFLMDGAATPTGVTRTPAAFL